MRVTDSVLVGNFLNNLNNNMSRMEELQGQLSSGKRITKPSDDPVGLVYSLRYRSSLNEVDKYSANVDDATSWLNSADTALDQINTLVQRIRTLTVQAANGDLPQVSQDAISEEVKQLQEQLIQVGNTTFSGRYIFSGTKTLTPAFDTTGAYQGNTNAINYEIAQGSNLQVNVTGDQLFGNLFTTLTQLQTDLAPGGVKSDITTQLGNLDGVIDNLLNIRADVGARVNRLDLTKNRYSDSKINLSDLLSKNEDADMAQTIMNLTMQQNVYKAALGAGANIIQPTLMDFLR